MMNRLLTLAAGGLIAGMSILPVAAFAQTGASPATDAKAPVATTTQTDAKTVTPSAAAVTKSHKVEAKTEAKGDMTIKHEGTTGAVKAPTSTSSVQPKALEPGKS
jgi:hypothetical protein